MILFETCTVPFVAAAIDFTEFVFMHVCLCPQDPAIATSKRQGNAAYESYDRGTEKNAWVTESDGKTPLLGEVRQRFLLHCCSCPCCCLHF